MIYYVSTQHTGDEAFIVPIEVEAESSIEAARYRFSLLGQRKNVTALLVRHGDDTWGYAWVFPVQTERAVVDEPVTFGASK